LKQFGTTLPIDGYTGWGIYGLNLALQSLRRGVMPVILIGPQWRTLHPFDRAMLMAAEGTRLEFERRIVSAAEQEVAIDGPLIVALGNQLAGTAFPSKLHGTSNVGCVVLEDSELGAAVVEKAKSFAKIIVGSNWNLRILQGYGIKNAALVWQAIDPSLFCPRPKSGLWANYFVIFSGGKLEYRKGQDIVVAAVRKFQERHPEAILAFSWNNSVPRTMTEIEAGGLVSGIPVIGTNGLADFGGWLTKQGLTRFLDLGPQLNWQMGAILRDVDVAIFPNRAEGGTNLVAMECMACGIPTILSANTGHLDLISDENCYVLKEQGSVRLTPFYKSVAGWGESSVDELVENLERVYRDRQEAGKRGAAGAVGMSKWSWEKQMGGLLGEIGVLL
jgi:glycosyltransferase involved in cell wall biosynthesis